MSICKYFQISIQIQSTSEPSISDKGFSTCMRRGIFRTAKSLTFDRRKKSVTFVIFPLLIFSKYSDPKALPCEIRAQWYGLVYARAVHCSQCAFPLPVRLLSSKTSPNNTPCLWKKGRGSCIRQGTPLSVWTECWVLYGSLHGNEVLTGSLELKSPLHLLAMRLPTHSLIDTVLLPVKQTNKMEVVVAFQLYFSK